MKYTILFLALLLLGCDEVPCDYTAFIDQNNNLMTQNTALQADKSNLQADKSKCDIDLANSKNDNSITKLQMLNNLNNMTLNCNKNSDSYYVNKLDNCETNLEDCWIHQNQTMECDNETVSDMLNDCNDILQEINNTLN